MGCGSGVIHEANPYESAVRLSRIFVSNVNTLDFPIGELKKSFGGRIPGASRDGATPVPIPNTAVKPIHANGTRTARSRESRSVPGTVPLKLAKAKLIW